MSKVLYFNTKELNDLMMTKQTIFIDFYATWCGPCQMLNPEIAKLAEAYEAIKVVKIDIDKEPKLAETFGVQSVPTMFLIKDGKIHKSLSGFHPFKKISEWIED